MKVLKFFPADKVLQYLEKEIDQVAEEHGVHHLDSIMWKDENTPEKGYIGYFMQITEPMYDSEDILINENLNNKSRPSDYQKHIQIDCEDIFSLIDYLRHIIGITLLYKKNEINQINQPSDSNRHYFWFYGNTAFILCNTLSDKIQDYLIKSIIKINGKKQLKDYINKKPYHFPFKESINVIKNHFIKYGFYRSKYSFGYSFINTIEDNLIDVCKRVEKKRKKRNKIVHRITTEEGNFEKEFLNSIIPNILYGGYDDRFYKQNSEEIKNYRIGRVENRVSELAEWYNDLLWLGNIVFKAEFLTRNKL